MEVCVCPKREKERSGTGKERNGQDRNGKERTCFVWLKVGRECPWLPGPRDSRGFWERRCEEGARRSSPFLTRREAFGSPRGPPSWPAMRAGAGAPPQGVATAPPQAGEGEARLLTRRPAPLRWARAGVQSPRRPACAPRASPGCPPRGHRLVPLLVPQRRPQLQGRLRP